MTTALRQWNIVRALPNLVLASTSENATVKTADLRLAGMTLGSSDMAIVPGTDPRVRAAAERDPFVMQLTRCFRSEYGELLEPSYLIDVKDTSIENTAAAINSFRNAIAVAVVLPSKAAFVRTGSHQMPQWTDHFDFHPTLAGRHGLVTRSTAILNLRAPDEELIAMPSAHIPDRVDMVVSDSYLYRALGAEWRRRFELGGRRSPYSRALFRSLEVAYSAAAAPTKHGGSENEWGVQVALWVSALEILAWRQGKNVNRRATLAALGSVRWEPSTWLRSRRFRISHRVRTGDKPRHAPAPRGNAWQAAAHLLYEARNAYLHGDRLRKSLLKPWGPEGVSLPAVAPLVYRTALKNYLLTRHETKSIDPSAAGFIEEWIDDTTSSDALRQALGRRR